MKQLYKHRIQAKLLLDELGGHMDLAVTIIKALLTVGFVVFGAGKVFNIPNLTPMVSESFTKFGLDKNMMKLTGTGELIGAAFLWIPFVPTHDNIGAALLSAIAILAVIYHVKFKDGFSDLMPAIAMAVLSVFVAIVA